MQELLWSKEQCPYFKPSYGQEIPALELYLHDDDVQRPAMVIFPGGGYSCRAPHEGAGYAEFFFEKGYQCFVVSYRVAPYAHPVMLTDGLRAIRYVRHHAERFHVDPNRVAIIGSSAGGHLAVTCTTHYTDAVPVTDAIDLENPRPDATVLCYPVVTLSELSHKGTRTNFLAGHDDKEALIQAYSGENAVHENCPPVFIWHADQDPTVPVENSLMLTLALKQNNIPVSLHIYPDNRHGAGLDLAHPLLHGWSEAALDWLKIYLA